MSGPLSGSTRRAAWRRAQVRRGVAGLLAGVATWVVVTALLPHPAQAGVPVVVVVRDLPLGSRVGVDDVQVELRPQAERPGAAVVSTADAVGQVTAGPVGAGEVLTTTRFRGAPPLRGLMPSRVAMSIPLVDDGLLPALRAGDAVTVLVPGTGSSVARAAPVLSVGSPDGGGDPTAATGLGAVASSGRSAHVVVALTREEAGAVVAAMGGATGLTGFVVTLEST